MIPRVNTLGKSAIIDRRLNSAYDVVEYVADNLPLLIESAHKIQLIANINYVKDHVDNSDIHMSSEDREKLNQVLSMNNVTQSELNQEIENLTTRIDNIVSSLGSFASHIEDSTSHLNQEDREAIARINSILQSISTIETRINNLESSNHSITLDSSLNLFSENGVMNKTITKAINEKVSRESLARVALTGNYEHLTNKPIPDTTVTQGSNRFITSGAVYDALSGIDDINIESIPLSDIQEMFGEQ